MDPTKPAQLPILKSGDIVGLITPSFAKSMVPVACLKRADRQLRSLGLQVAWAPNTGFTDVFQSNLVTARVADIHWAFRTPEIKAILCVIGGFNANQLLELVDWQLIAQNPKPLIGHSDITVLANALLAKTGQVAYYGPNLYSLGADKKYAEQTAGWLKKTLMGGEPVELRETPAWAEWQPGWGATKSAGQRQSLAVLAPGTAEGRLIGGNASSFYLLQGTPYMPRFDQPTILLLEDDDLAGEYTLAEFDRRLVSLLQQPGAAENIRGVLIGTFQSGAGVTMERLRASLLAMPTLAGKPLVANVPIGHTEPKCTFPIGGQVRMEATRSGAIVTIVPRSTNPVTEV